MFVVFIIPRFDRLISLTLFCFETDYLNQLCLYQTVSELLAFLIVGRALDVGLRLTNGRFEPDDSNVERVTLSVSFT